MYSFAQSCVYPALAHPPWLAHLLPFAHGKDTNVPWEQTVNNS